MSSRTARAIKRNPVSKKKKKKKRKKERKKTKESRRKEKNIAYVTRFKQLNTGNVIAAGLLESLILLT